MKIRNANIILNLIVVVFAMVLTVISPLLIPVSKEFSLSMSESGIVFTLSFIGFVLFVFTGGYLADRFGKKKVLLIALLGMSLSLLLLTLSRSFAVYAFFILLIGGFGGVVESGANALVSEINTKHRNFYLNLMQVSFGIGAIAGPTAASWVIASNINWRACYQILGLSAVLLTLILWAVKFPKEEAVSRESLTPQGLTEILTDWKFMVICACMFLYTGSELGAWGWMATFLEGVPGFDIAKAGLAVGVFWAAMTVGRLICGLLTFKVRTTLLVVILSFSSFASVILSVLVHTEAALWVVTALMGLSFSSIWPLLVGYGGEHRKSSSGIAFALLIGSGGIGGAVVPLAMGYIGQYAGKKPAMVLPAVLLMIIGVIFSFYHRGRDKE